MLGVPKSFPPRTLCASARKPTTALFRWPQIVGLVSERGCHQHARFLGNHRLAADTRIVAFLNDRGVQAAVHPPPDDLDRGQRVRPDVVHRIERPRCLIAAVRGPADEHLLEPSKIGVRCRVPFPQQRPRRFHVAFQGWARIRKAPGRAAIAGYVGPAKQRIEKVGFHPILDHRHASLCPAGAVANPHGRCGRTRWEQGGSTSSTQ